MGVIQWMTVLVLLLAVGGFVLGITITRAPTPPAANANLAEMDTSVYAYDIHRFTDLDGTVTCWAYKQGTHAAGISCLATESIQRVKE